MEMNKSLYALVGKDNVHVIQDIALQRHNSSIEE